MHAVASVPQPSGSRTSEQKLAASYLPVPTFGAAVHLAVVFGVVVKESRLAFVDCDHAAVVWVILSVLAEELPAHHVSAREQRLNLCPRASPSHHETEQSLVYPAALLRGLTPAGRVCTCPKRTVCRRRSRFLWCYGYSSTWRLV